MNAILVRSYVRARPVKRSELAIMDLFEVVELRPELFAPAKKEKRRSDGRAHDTGMIKPMRPCPADFRERFIELGWGSIGHHYRANWRCIRRWINESGGDVLKQERADYVRANGNQRLHVSPPGDCLADRQRRRKRYVLGRTLSDRGAK